MLVRCNLKGSVSEPNEQYGFAGADRAGAAPRVWLNRMAGGLVGKIVTANDKFGPSSTQAALSACRRGALVRVMYVRQIRNCVMTQSPTRDSASVASVAIIPPSIRWLLISAMCDTQLCVQL